MQAWAGSGRRNLLLLHSGVGPACPASKELVWWPLPSSHALLACPSPALMPNHHLSPLPGHLVQQHGWMWSQLHLPRGCCSHHPCKSLASKVACHRVSRLAPRSGSCLSVIRRCNPISYNWRASETLEKKMPVVFWSNEGNKYRKDYIKWANVWNNLIAIHNFHSYTVVIE